MGLPMVLNHGDLHLRNSLFDDEKNRACIYDFQSVQKQFGPGYDLGTLLLSMVLYYSTFFIFSLISEMF